MTRWGANSKAWEPSCLTQRPVVCPAAPVRGPQNITLIGGARTIVTSPPEYTGGMNLTGDATERNLCPERRNTL